jgi:hypothetical protein
MRTLADRVPVVARRSAWLSAVAVMLGFLAVTNRWMSWAAGYRLLTAHDEADYRIIARAAPHLPAAKVQQQHAQRFPFHYLIGLLARGAGVNVDILYSVAVVIVGVGLCVVLWRVLAEIGLSDRASAVCLGVFALNTYSLRYYAIAPGEIADLLLEAGVLISILGLVQRRYWLVMTGVVFATLARQTELPASVVMAGWVYGGPGWRQAATATRLGRGAALLLAAAVIYAAEIVVSAPFSSHTTPDLAHFTMLSELEHLPSGGGEFAQHLLRSVNGLFAVGALLLVTLLAWSRRARIASLPWAFWAFLLLAASISLQPVIFSAQYAAHNETRLAILGLIPFVCALAVVLRELEHTGWTLSVRSCAGLIAILGLDSFHHLYTIIGTHDASQTVLLQGLCAIALLILGSRAFVRRATASA